MRTIHVDALTRPTLVMTALLLPGLAQADLSLAVGASNASQPSLTLALDRAFSLHDWHPALSLRLAGGVLLLPGDQGDANAALLLTPAFRYRFTDSAWQPFVEAGIGAALFLDTHYEERHLSSAFQFEDRLAAGMHLGDGELMLSLTHYSNANIETPNQGLNVAAVGYRLPL